MILVSSHKQIFLRNMLISRQVVQVDVILLKAFDQHLVFSQLSISYVILEIVVQVLDKVLI